MERYKTRPGVILTEIAGEYVLVAAKALLEECPYVTQINESSAFLWKQLEHAASLDDLAEAVTKEYEIEDPSGVLEEIQGFVRQMNKMNYLLVERTEEINENGKE